MQNFLHKQNPEISNGSIGIWKWENIFPKPVFQLAFWSERQRILLLVEQSLYMYLRLEIVACFLRDTMPHFSGSFRVVNCCRVGKVTVLITKYMPPCLANNNDFFSHSCPSHAFTDIGNVIAGIDNIADLGKAAIQNRIRCAALVDSVMFDCITVRPRSRRSFRV